MAAEHVEIISNGQSMDITTNEEEENCENNYRPYQYKATSVTRPLLQATANGKGINFTEWDEEHLFAYFRYWIGRHCPFSGGGAATAADIASALSTVCIREDLADDLENIAEDLVVDERQEDIEEMEESMILNEDEFVAFGWNLDQQRVFRLVCCRVIDVIPVYRQWIDHLSLCQSVEDMTPQNDCPCPRLPCPALHRLLIVNRFYKDWMQRNFGNLLSPHNRFHFAVHEFMQCLEHYTQIDCSNDWHHLYHCHIEPTNAADNGLEADSTDDSDTADDEKGAGCGPVLDEEGRNVYEWFEDHLDDCDPSTCAIFERTFRSRYDVNFENEADKYYSLRMKPRKEREGWLERIAEIESQKTLDGMHMCLFHASARYDASGLGNSEAHRKFLMLSTEKQKRIKREMKKR